MKNNIIKILLNAGADWTIKNKHGKDFIDGLRSYSVLKGYPEIYETAKLRNITEKYNL